MQPPWVLTVGPALIGAIGVPPDFPQPRHIYCEFLKSNFSFLNAFGTMGHQTKVICERKGPTQLTRGSSYKGAEATYFTDYLELESQLSNYHISLSRNELGIDSGKEKAKAVLVCGESDYSDVVPTSMTISSTSENKTAIVRRVLKSSACELASD